MSKKNITINDVAKAAGVSKATVSRYLNGHSELMTEKTRERIAGVIELLNYRPSEVARSLKSRKTRTIGVILSDIRSPFYAAVISGVEEKLLEHGYSAIFMNSNGNVETELRNVENLISRGVDGILLNTVSFSNEELISVTANRIPLVLVDRDVNNHRFSSAGVDNEMMLSLLFDHLQAEGYDRFAYFTEQWDRNSTRIARRQFFLKNVNERFGTCAVEDVYTVGQDYGSYADALEAFLSSLKPGDRPCIIGGNSDFTFSAYHALMERGVKIPEEMGIAGPEDWAWGGDMSWPDMLATPVTTISFDTVELGRLAAELMVERVEDPGSGIRDIKIPVELNIRKSTKGTGIRE